MTGARKDDGGFLERWSRRKRASDEADVAPAAELEPAVTEELTEEISPEELAALPAPEDITSDTDITPFLKRGVPRALKNAALRRSWLSNPAIRDHKDLAVDYAWDWNVPGGVPGSGGPLSSRSVADLLRKMAQDEPSVSEDVREQEPPLKTAEPARGASSAERAASGQAPEERSADKIHTPAEPDVESPPASREARRHGGARPV